MRLHGTKTLYTAKVTINKMKRQHMEWEKIVVNHISDKGFISKIFKKFIKNDSKKSNLKWTKDLNRGFSKENIPTNGQQISKRCSISLIIREMQINTTTKYYNWITGSSAYCKEG